MVKKIFVILFSILFLTIGLTILPKPEKEDNNMADALQGTWVFNDRLFGGNLELLDIQFILNFDSSGSHLTGLAFSQSTRPDNEIALMAYDDVGRVYFGDQFDEEDTTSDRWGHESFKTITITSKLSEVTDGDVLLTWLQANATKQETDTSKKLTKLKYKVSDVCQLFDKDKFFATRTAHGVVFTNNGDGSFTINGTCDSDADADTPLFLPPVDYSITFDLYSIENHKYLLIPLPQAFSYNTLRFVFGTGAVPYYETSNTYEIYTATKTGTYPCYAIYRVGKGTTINNVTVKPQLFDLTEMYGAGNEPTTVEEFRQKYPNDLYPYSPQCWYPINKTRYMSNQYGNSVLTNNIYVYHNDAQKFFYIVDWSGATLYKRVASNVIPKIGLLDYKAVSNGDLYDFISNDKTVSLGFPGMYDNFIMVRDLSFNGNTEKFKQFIVGNNVWFELETPTQGGYLPLNKGVKV